MLHIRSVAWEDSAPSRGLTRDTWDGSHGGDMERMSPLDASFLYMENDVTPLHIGGVSIFEGPPPSHDELISQLAAKLHQVPRYRQKVRMMPLNVGLPVWVDDPHFNIDYHVRRS